MFVRLQYLTGDPGSFDRLTGYVRSQLQPALEGLDGSIGVAVWADPLAGDVIVASVWASAATLAASESAEAPLRTQVAELTGSTVRVEQYEAALVDALRPIRVGNVTRIITISATAEHVCDHLSWAREQVIPVLRGLPGYHAYFCGVDPHTGRAVVMTTYDDRTDADIALMTTSNLNSAATDRGICIESSREYDVAIAGIEITLPPPPTQRGGQADRDDAVFWSPASG